MVVQSVEFMSQLKQANIIGCLYRIVPGPWGKHIPEISLIGVNIDPLKRAFAEFRRWDPEDGDAVKLTFIIPSAGGGYTLAIEWERSRATYALTGFDRFFSHFLAGGTYAKSLDTKNTFVQDFRAYVERFGVSPFFFGASVMENKQTSSQFENVKPLADVPPLLKFEAEFVDERDLKPRSLFAQLLASKNVKPASRQSARKDSLFEEHESGPEKQKLPDYSVRRETILNRHFPLTIERIRSGRFSHTLENVCRQEIEIWQFEQAICNLLLSGEMLNGKPFYPGIAREDLIAQIARATNAREEQSDTRLPSDFSTDLIIEQVRLDGIALLANVRRPPFPSELRTIQNELRTRGFLEPLNA